MCIDSYADISIHTPTRGTTAGTGTATNLAEFQSTLPREERPFPTDFVTAFMPYFNPRSHERSDFTGDYTFEVTLISIHAPTRGATKVACYLATLIKFQSTLPREERPVRRYSLPLISVNFNPRSHERSDNIQNLTFALTKRFQSTLPREERPLLFVSFIRLTTISIHAPTRGATDDIQARAKMLKISIHAPTRGATAMWSLCS